MRLAISTLLDRLAAEGLVPPDAPQDARRALAAAAADDTPWYARVAAGFGAWVATLLLLGFLFGAGLDRAGGAALVVGLLLVGGAVAVRRAARAEFARQLALAASFAGQGLVVLRLGDWTDSLAVGAATALLLSVLLVALMPDALHRFLSALMGAIAFVAVVVDQRLAWGVDPTAGGLDLAVRGSDLAVLLVAAGAALAWRARAATADRTRATVLEPVGYGLVAALLGLLLADAMLGPSTAWLAGGGRARDWQLGLLTTIGIAAALGLLLRRVLRERGAAGVPVVAGLAGVVLLAALTLPTPGIVAAVATLALGFDRRRPVLVGLAALFLVAFLALYYQSLRLTLLEKSGVLVASGALLLLARAYVMRRLLPHDPAAVRS